MWRCQSKRSNLLMGLSQDGRDKKPDTEHHHISYNRRRGAGETAPKRLHRPPHRAARPQHHRLSLHNRQPHQAHTRGTRTTVRCCAAPWGGASGQRLRACACASATAAAYADAPTRCWNSSVALLPKDTSTDLLVLLRRALARTMLATVLNSSLASSRGLPGTTVL